MRGMKTVRTTSVVIRGHAFVQNVRRGHCQFDHHTEANTRLNAAFDELLTTLCR